VWWAAMLLTSQARAVDFQFYYDDAANQGFLDLVQGPIRRAALKEAAEI
jgi:hypothetical protein